MVVTIKRNAEDIFFLVFSTSTCLKQAYLVQKFLLLVNFSVSQNHFMGESRGSVLEESDKIEILLQKAVLLQKWF